MIKDIEYKYRKLINIIVLLFYKILRAFYKNKNSKLHTIILNNRKTLSETHSLLSKNQYVENNYGIPGNIFLCIDKPIDSFPTYSNNLSVLDYKLERFKKVHFEVSPIWDYFFDSFSPFSIRKNSFNSRNFEFIGKQK